MMTDLLYQLDSYLKDCQAIVTQVDETGRRLALDRTVFYPGGGGQPADAGQIVAGETVLQIARAQKDAAGDVWHVVNGPGELPTVGAKVTARVDWERRHQLMRTHTAMHILCGVIFRDYGALVTGGDMDPLKGRMDFEFETLQKELVQVIETAVNVEVQAARPVSVAVLPREEAFQNSRPDPHQN